MVLGLINKEIELYKRFIVSAEYDELYKWEALKSFQDDWNIGDDNLKSKYDRSFHSKYNNNLWVNPHWFSNFLMIRTNKLKH